MKLRNILGLMLATAALSACGGNKDGKTGAVDGADYMAPPAADTTSPEAAPPAAEIIPPSAEPEAASPEDAEGALDAAKDKAGEMMKEGAVDAAKEAVTY